MSAAVVGRKRPPYFTTTVDVDIEPDELEAEGWVYVGKDAEGATPEENKGALDIVEKWHELTHEGPFVWCQHEPCHEIGLQA